MFMLFRSNKTTGRTSRSCMSKLPRDHIASRAHFASRVSTVLSFSFSTTILPYSYSTARHGSNSLREQTVELLPLRVTTRHTALVAQMDVSTAVLQELDFKESCKHVLTRRHMLQIR